MKTNQRFIKMMLALVAMFMSMQVMAATKEVYAVYTSANGGTLTFYYDDLMSTRNGVYKEELNDVNDTPWWVDHAYKFKKVVFTSSFADARPKSTRCWFSDQPNFTIEGLGNLNTSEVEDMSWMFSGSGITGFDLSSFQTGSVKNMGGMFQECSKLISIDLSCLDTHSVTDMSQLFMDCGSLTSVNLSGLDARSVTEMSHMFSGCSSLTGLNFSSFTTRDLTNTDAMFENCTSLASLNLRNFNTSNVTSMSWMFFECTSLTSLDLSDFDTGNVTDMSVMFDSADKLTTIYVGEKWSTANVSESDYMFNDCTSLVGEKGTVYSDDYIDKEYAHKDGGTSNPGYLSFHPEAYAVYNNGTLFFYYDTDKSTRTGTKYEMNALGSKPGWYTEHRNDIKKVVFMSTFKNVRPVSTSYWFAADVDDDWNSTSQLTTITGIKYLNTSQVKDMSFMFYQCTKLTTLDVSGFNTSNVITMKSMFDGCESLTTLNVSGFNTRKVITMERMFCCCYALEALDVSKWNTAKVINMNSVFSYCSHLSTLNVGNWNTANVTEMSGLFDGCQNLTALDVSKWNTAKVTDMSLMFDECYKLTGVLLSDWNTAKVTDMYAMFYRCDELTSLDLSSFDTRKVTDMSCMFAYDDNLTTVYVGNLWSTAKLSTIETKYSANGWENMFIDCSSIKGEKGTTYNSNKIGKEYAHVDGDQSNPGYLSALPYDLKIAGKTVTSMNQSDILENGIFSYSPKSNTLSVKGSYTYNVNERFMESSIDGLTINVTQDVTLEGRPDWPLISLNAGTTTFTGNGKLTLKKQNETGIYLTHSSSVIIKDMDMEIDALWGIAGPRDSHGQESLTIESSNITIKTSDKQPSDRTAICDLPGGIYLQGCSITSPSGAYISGGAVKTSNGSVAQDVTITVGNGIATNIDNGQRDSVKGQKDGWYTIDGRKLNGKPAKKGLYIHNGKTVVN